MYDLSTGTTVTEASETAKTALTTLSRLGRIDEARPILADAASKTYDHITNDISRTPEWKTGAAAKAYTGVMSNLAKRLTTAANIASTQNSDDSSRVFGVKGLTGDPAALANSRRDAVDRAAKITDPRERQAHLKDALDHDPVMARALLSSAVQMGDIDSVNTFSDRHPVHDKALQRLWDAARSADNPPPMIEHFAIAALKPTPLKSMADFQIASLADATPE